MLSHWVVAGIRPEFESAGEPELVPSKEALVVAFRRVGRGQSRNETPWGGLISYGSEVGI